MLLKIMLYYKEASGESKPCIIRNASIAERVQALAAMFMTLQEAEIVIENWRRHYNYRRPHRSLGGQPPAPLTFFAPPMGGAMGPLSPPPELSCIPMAEEASQSAYQ